MRWERLFADLEARFDAEERVALDADVAGLVRAERARLTLADRLRPHRDAELTWQLTSPGAGDVDGVPDHRLPIRAVLRDAGPDWLLLEPSSRDGTVARPHLLVPLGSVQWIGGLGRAALPDDREVTRRMGLTVILRGLSRDRAAVRVLSPGGAFTGTIDRVGADHLDLAVHDLDVARRIGQVREVRCVPLAAVTAIALTDDSI